MWRDGEHCSSVAEMTRYGEEIDALEGDISTAEAQAALAKYMYSNPTFTMKLLTGVDIYPFQDILMRTMLIKDSTLAILGRGFSKSFTAALFAPYFALFHPGTAVGIVSATFRQARRIFKQIERWSDSKEGIFLRQCIGKVSHYGDAYEMEVGDSTIVALPLGSGEKIRGYRFNVMIIDELLLLTDRVVEEIIRPFMAIQHEPRLRQQVRVAEDKLIKAGKLKPEDRYQFLNNKLIGLSSASYTFEYLYKMYKDFQKMIFDEHAEHVSNAIFQLSHACAPAGLYDKANVEQAKRTMSHAQFGREYQAQFTDETSGYFSPKRLMEARIPAGEHPHIKIKGDKGKDYILAIDPH